MTNRVLRCAVYTRKSTDEGLDQDFNSLQAQREACEAFIKSQRSEGWTLIPASYDDGGISGGTMERPALRRLLAHIEEKRVDVVVVYKVDRLTRSLADFSKMVELFDRNGVSFVAVTQQFNTTTSMGRLTLNVLLSFAQFEREVTAERIRDKIAASKKKGLWMGGPTPFGYRVCERKLVVDPYGAQIVKSLYDLYLKLGTVQRLTAYVRKRAGQPLSDPPDRRLSRGGFYTILRNPVYIGMIRHKREMYPGQHEAILDRATWDAVQERLTQNGQNAGWSLKQREDFPLRGKLLDDTGEPIKPYAANKQGKRYRYYVSRPEDAAANSGTAWRLPALEIEKKVDLIAREMLSDPQAIVTAAKDASLTTLEAESLSEDLSTTTFAQRLRLVSRVTVGTDALTVGLALPGRVPVPIERSMAMVVKQRGKERRLVLPAAADAQHASDPNILKALRTAFQFWEQLQSDNPMTAAEFARKHGLDNRYVGRALQLRFLAPRLIERLVRGKLPECSAEELLRWQNLPPAWGKQESAMGR